MASFVKQSVFSSDSSITRKRTAFLIEEKSKIQEAIKDYLAKYPNGEQVTLHVFHYLGRKRIEMLAQENKKSLASIKQSIGLYVPIVLCDLFSPEKIESLRKTNGTTNLPRKVTKDYTDLLGWVSFYTPHRVIN